MKVSEYASDVNLSVAEILKKCHELAINVNNKDDYLTDDDIIMLDNTINLISTDDEITFEEEEDIEDKVDEIMTSSRVDKSMKDSVSKEKLKKKDTSKQDFNLKKKEMYKHFYPNNPKSSILFTIYTAPNIKTKITIKIIIFIIIVLLSLYEISANSF